MMKYIDIYFIKSTTASFLYLFVSFILIAWLSPLFLPYYSFWPFFIATLYLLIPDVPQAQSGLRIKILMGLIIAIVLGISYFINQYPILMIVYIAILTGINIMVREYYSSYAWPTFVSSVLVIALNELTFFMFKSLVLAIIVILLMQIAMQFMEKPIIRRKYFFNYHLELKQLINDLFNCFLDPDYSHNIYIFEQRLHKHKMKCLKLSSDLQQRISAIHKADLKSREQSYLNFLESIYQHIQNISILRWRVTDFTAFSLCLQELRGVKGELEINLNHSFQKIQNPVYTFQTPALTYWINRLDDNYHNVLQVAAREPLVFALFIDGLFALRDAFDQFNNEKAI